MQCARSCRQKLSLTNVFTFRSKPKTVIQELSFVLCICIEKLIVVIHLVYWFAIRFSIALFIRFSCKSLVHFALNSYKTPKEGKPNCRLELLCLIGLSLPYLNYLKTGLMFLWRIYGLTVACGKFYVPKKEKQYNVF